MTDQSSKQRRRTPVGAIMAIAASRAISGLAVERRRSKTFTPDMSLPRRFAPHAMCSRRCPGLLSWQRANMARQRHLKISCDRLTATLAVTPAACQTSAYQENTFGGFCLHR